MSAEKLIESIINESLKFTNDEVKQVRAIARKKYGQLESGDNASMSFMFKSSKDATKFQDALDDEFGMDALSSDPIKDRGYFIVSVEPA